MKTKHLILSGAWLLAVTSLSLTQPGGPRGGQGRGPQNPGGPGPQGGGPDGFTG